jgi:ribosome recycling factor
MFTQQEEVKKLMDKTIVKTDTILTAKEKEIMQI